MNPQQLQESENPWASKPCVSTMNSDTNEVSALSVPFAAPDPNPLPLAAPQSESLAAQVLGPTVLESTDLSAPVVETLTQTQDQKQPPCLAVDSDEDTDTNQELPLPDEGSPVKPNNFKSFVLNFTDGHSYDRAFQMHKVRDRKVMTLSTDCLREIHRALLALSQDTDTSCATDEKQVLALLGSAIEVRDAVKQVGFDNTTVNFECCSSYGASCGSLHDKSSHFLFNTTEKSVATIDFIVFMLSQRSQVICADFALKALISNWDEKKFGAQCPLSNVSTIQGSLRVRYGIDSCKECDFPQLRSLAQLALPDRNEENKSSVPQSVHVDAVPVDASVASTVAVDTTVPVDDVSVEKGIKEQTEQKAVPDQTIVDQSSKQDSEKSSGPKISVSSMTMEAMGNTIVYAVNKTLDPKLSIKVLSVSTGRVERGDSHDAPFSPLLQLQAQSAKVGNKNLTLCPPLPPLLKKYQTTTTTTALFPSVHLEPLKLKRQNACGTMDIEGVQKNGQPVTELLSPKTKKLIEAQSPLSPVQLANYATTVVEEEKLTDGEKKEDGDDDEDKSMAQPPLLMIVNATPDEKNTTTATPLFPLYPVNAAPVPLVPLKREVTIAEEPVRRVDYKVMVTEKIVPFKETENDSVAHGTQIKGIPVHAVITFEHLPGTLVVSSLHLTNLIQVNTDAQHLLRVARNVLGRQRSEQMQNALMYAESQTPELLRATTSALVSEITSSSSSIPHPSKPRGGKISKGLSAPAPN